MRKGESRQSINNFNKMLERLRADDELVTVKGGKGKCYKVHIERAIVGS